MYVHLDMHDVHAHWRSARYCAFALSRQFSMQAAFVGLQVNRHCSGAVEQEMLLQARAAVGHAGEESAALAEKHVAQVVLDVSSASATAHSHRFGVVTVTVLLPLPAPPLLPPPPPPPPTPAPPPPLLSPPPAADTPVPPETTAAFELGTSGLRGG